MWALRGKCGCLSEGAAGSLGGQRLSLGWAVPASSEQQEGPTGILRCLFTDSLLPQEAQKNPWPEKTNSGFKASLSQLPLPAWGGVGEAPGVGGWAPCGMVGATLSKRAQDVWRQSPRGGGPGSGFETLGKPTPASVSPSIQHVCL